MICSLDAHQNIWMYKYNGWHNVSFPSMENLISMHLHKLCTCVADAWGLDFILKNLRYLRSKKLNKMKSIICLQHII